MISALSCPALPGIQVLFFSYVEDVDGRDKPGHDGFCSALKLQTFLGGELFKARAERLTAIGLVDERAEELRRLAAIEFEQRRLDGAHGGRTERQRAITERGQRHR